MSPPDDMRQEAEWMIRAIDDLVLEALRDDGRLTPKLLGLQTGKTADYCGERTRKMAEYGLVKKVDHGVYEITDLGEAYLDEELDASELEPVDD